MEKQDLTFLKWSHARHSGGTAGMFLKSSSELGGMKKYYKLSDYDPERGIVGHECINEVIADRLLTILGVEHLSYELINADIMIEGKIYSTYLCASDDFRKRGESKTALDNFYEHNALKGESHYDFCVRMGWKDYTDTMIAVDHIILNRDRHGANIEVLRDERARTVRIAPLFDHGSSLLCSCHSDAEAADFDITKEWPCNNFIGGRSCRDNLKLTGGREVFAGRLEPSDRTVLFEGLDGIMSDVFQEKIWKMIWERYNIYEDLRDRK
jgi:hypothetical protein